MCILTVSENARKLNIFLGTECSAWSFLKKNFFKRNSLFILLIHPAKDIIAEMANGEDPANTKLLEINKSDNYVIKNYKESTEGIYYSKC